MQFAFYLKCKSAFLRKLFELNFERNFVNYGNVEYEHKTMNTKRSPKVIDDTTANVSDSNETLQIE